LFSVRLRKSIQSAAVKRAIERRIGRPGESVGATWLALEAIGLRSRRFLMLNAGNRHSRRPLGVAAMVALAGAVHHWSGPQHRHPSPKATADLELEPGRYPGRGPGSVRPGERYLFRHYHQSVGRLPRHGFSAAHFRQRPRQGSEFLWHSTRSDIYGPVSAMVVTRPEESSRLMGKPKSS
jgi:hypothetical protein